MPKVCLDRNHAIIGGKLALAPWSRPRLVAQVSASSSADGAISSAGLTTQPGRQLINATIGWTNTGPLTALVQLLVIRPYRTIITSNPNVVEMWDRWTTAVNKTPAEPNSYALVNSLLTLGPDVGTDNAAQPYYARIHQDYPATCSEEWFELASGDTLNVWFRTYVWTPMPWSNNASANNPLHEAHARGVKLRLLAYPTADPEVR